MILSLCDSSGDFVFDIEKTVGIGFSVQIVVAVGKIGEKLKGMQGDLKKKDTKALTSALDLINVAYAGRGEISDAVFQIAEPYVWKGVPTRSRP